MTDKPIKTTILLCLSAFALGVLFAVGLNSTGHVIKVDVVAPAGYTEAQRDRMDKLLDGVK